MELLLRLGVPTMLRMEAITMTKTKQTPLDRAKQLDGHARREALKKLGMCTACAKRKAAPEHPECVRCVRYYKMKNAQYTKAAKK